MLLKTVEGQIESLEICIWAWIQRAYLTCTPHLPRSNIKGFLSLCVIMYLSPIVSGYCLALKCVIDRNNVKFYTGQVFNITKEANGSIYEKETKRGSVFLLTLVTALSPLCQILPYAKHKTKSLSFVRDFFNFIKYRHTDQISLFAHSAMEVGHIY